MKHIKKFKVFEEGKTFNVTKQKNKKEVWEEPQKDAFRDKIKSHIKSLGCTSEQIGNDLSILLNKEHITQVMFRDDYIGIKKVGNKFGDEFGYNKLGEIKKELTKIIKSSKEDNEQIRKI